VRERKKELQRVVENESERERKKRERKEEREREKKGCKELLTKKETE
jgi:hypothetical protein